MVIERPIAFVDLDGTLFDNTHRRHLLPTGDGSTIEQWKTFNRACVEDELIQHMKALVNFLYMQDYNVVLLTGRAEHCRVETLHCLIHYHIHYHTLITRENNDHRKSADFKKEVLSCWFGSCTDSRRFPEGSFFIDDDPSVLAMVEEEFPELNIIKCASKCSSVQAGKSQAGE